MSEPDNQVSADHNKISLDRQTQTLLTQLAWQRSKTVVLMTIFILIAITLNTYFYFANRPTQEEKHPEIGRYQMIRRENKHSEDQLYRLDTATGYLYLYNDRRGEFKKVAN